MSWNDSIQTPEGRDVSLEADMSKTAGPDDRGYGLVWGVLDANNLYRFEVSGDGHFAIFRNSRGILSPILNWEEAEPAPCPLCSKDSERILSRFACFTTGEDVVMAPVGGSGCSSCNSSDCSSCGM